MHLDGPVLKARRAGGSGGKRYLAGRQVEKPKWKFRFMHFATALLLLIFAEPAITLNSLGMVRCRERAAERFHER